MPKSDSRFEFLTMAAFNQLPRREKVAYLEKAVAVIVEKHGDFTEQSLFKDGPPVPPPLVKPRKA